MCHCSTGNSCDRLEGRCSDGDVCTAGWTNYPACQTGDKYLSFVIITQSCNSVWLEYGRVTAWLEYVRDSSWKYEAIQYTIWKTCLDGSNSTGKLCVNSMLALVLNI